MKIITLARFFVIFTIVQCIPFPPDPDDSGSDNDIVIVSDPEDDDPPVIRIPSSPENSGPEDDDMDEQPIRIPSDPDDSEPEIIADNLPSDDDNDQQPPFLPNGVTGNEVIQQTPELIEVWVEAPESLRDFNPDDTVHHRDRHLLPSTSTGRRGGLNLRTEWARLARVSCLAQRTIGQREDSIRRNGVNIGN